MMSEPRSEGVSHGDDEGVDMWTSSYKVTIRNHSDAILKDLVLDIWVSDQDRSGIIGRTLASGARARLLPGEHWTEIATFRQPATGRYGGTPPRGFRVSNALVFRDAFDVVWLLDENHDLSEG